MSARSKGQKLPTLPQVNLLPPEIRAARGLRVVKRWLGLSLVLVVLLLGGAFGFSVLELGLAQSSLTEAQAETARLQVEEAKYAEVPAVLTAVETIKAARELGMSTEIDWRPYLDAITAVLPPGVSIESFNFSGATPMQVAPVPASPLDAPAVGSIQFSGRSVTLPDTAAWIVALNSVPGFSDAWVTAAAITGEDGEAYYQIESSVQVLESAYAERFIQQQEVEG